MNQIQTEVHKICCFISIKELITVLYYVTTQQRRIPKHILGMSWYCLLKLLQTFPLIHFIHFLSLDSVPHFAEYINPRVPSASRDIVFDHLHVNIDFWRLTVCSHIALTQR